MGSVQIAISVITFRALKATTSLNRSIQWPDSMVMSQFLANGQHPKRKAKACAKWYAVITNPSR